MHSQQLCRLSLRILLSLGLRSVIACIVLAAGTAALLTSVAVTEGARLRAALELERYGLRYAYVLPVASPAKNTRGPAGPEGLSSAIVRAVRQMPDCQAAGIVQRTVTIANGARRTEALVAGVDADYFRIRGLTATEGRLLREEDSRALARVAILSSSIARELFPALPGLGRMVRIKGMPFVVVGLLESRGTDPDGRDLDNVVFLPRTSAAVRVFGSSRVDLMIVRGRADESAADIAGRVTERLRGIRRRGEPPIAVREPDSVVSIGAQTEQVYRAWSLGAAIVGMVTGGIGIVAIMLISVKDRSAEIALRRAAGATQASVLWQFVFETSCLVAVGAVAGLVVGVALGIGISSALYGIRSFPWPKLVYAILPVAVGMLGGLIPSWVASRLNIVRVLAGGGGL